MSCLTSTQKAWYQERITALQAQLDAIDDAIINNTLHVEMASLDTGEGKQVMKYRSMEAMEKVQKRLEARILRYQHILNGTGIANMTLRRKND